MNTSKKQQFDDAQCAKERARISGSALSPGASLAAVVAVIPRSTSQKGPLHVKKSPKVRWSEGIRNEQIGNFQRSTDLGVCTKLWTAQHVEPLRRAMGFSVGTSGNTESRRLTEAPGPKSPAKWTPRPSKACLLLPEWAFG